MWNQTLTRLTTEDSSQKAALECGSLLPLSVRPASAVPSSRAVKPSKLALGKRQQAAALQSVCGRVRWLSCGSVLAVTVPIFTRRPGTATWREWCSTRAERRFRRPRSSFAILPRPNSADSDGRERLLHLSSLARGKLRIENCQGGFCFQGGARVGAASRRDGARRHSPGNRPQREPKSRLTPDRRWSKRLRPPSAMKLRIGG